MARTFSLNTKIFARTDQPVAKVELPETVHGDASGQRMIVVTHAMSFARTVAHQVHILHAGRIAESGPPEQIFEDPQQAITREFVSEAARA